jgi:hypothetical protein
VEDRPVEAAGVQPRRSPGLALALVLGAFVALALGVYGNVHDPSGTLVFTLLFSSTISLKVWLATIAVAFAVVQVLTALWIYGRLGVAAPSWAGPLHRASGRLAFIASLPVAYHCLWSLGFQDGSTRALVHSLAGCLVYGAFAAKVTIVRTHAGPSWVLPVAGGVMFTTLVAAWYTSAVWFVGERGWPPI